MAAMQNGKLWWLFGASSAVGGVLLMVLTVVVKHEPNFYRQGHVPPSKERKEISVQFLLRFAQMLANMNTPTWGCNATEGEINCVLQEMFSESNEVDSLRKLGISSPCINLDGTEVRFAFRYGKGWLSTVISYELKVWLIAKEPNVVGVQVLSARAGALPIPCQSILHQLSEFAGKQNYKMTLYRHDGTPVAIIRLQEDQGSPSATLTELKCGNNQLHIRGKTLNPVVDLKPPPSAKAPVH
jgi:hypothetical protein